MALLSQNPGSLHLPHSAPLPRRDGGRSWPGSAAPRPRAPSSLAFSGGRCSSLPPRHSHGSVCRHRMRAASAPPAPLLPAGRRRGEEGFIAEQQRLLCTSPLSQQLSWPELPVGASPPAVCPGCGDPVLIGVVRVPLPVQRLAEGQIHPDLMCWMFASVSVANAHLSCRSPGIFLKGRLI